MNKFFASSVDPSKLSLTIKGVIVGAIPFVIWFSKLQGWDIPETDLNNLAEQIGLTVEQVGGVVATVMVVWGLIRKIIVAVKPK